MHELRGRVAVVTGGASGIGRAMAERFLAEGMSVALADIEPNMLEKTATELAGQGPVLAVPTDVTDPDSVEALARTVREDFGTFHVVCNNAGVAGHFGRTWETPLEEWRWVLDVNIWGVIHGLRSFVPTLIDQGEGHVVNTASLAGWGAAPTMGPYCATKHAVLAISESLRAELDAADSGVGVSVVCPGMINTQIMNSERNWPASLGAEPAYLTDDLSRAVRDRLRTGTTGGGEPPEAVADAVIDGIRANRFVVTSHVEAIIASAQRRLDLARATSAPEG